MRINFKTDSLVKTALLTLASGILLSACGGDDAKPTKGSTDGRSSFETLTDHALGNADAPITLVEYASVTCPHCATWSLSVFPELRKKYVDSGKVRYVFREFPTPPVDLANAGHLLANCAAEDKYFDLLHTMFKRQTELRVSSDKKGEFVKLAKSAGMSEADFDACMVNQKEIDRLGAVIRGGENAGVTGTPTFFINGVLAKNIFTLEQFEEKFSPILGDDMPKLKKDDAEKPAESDGTGH